MIRVVYNLIYALLRSNMITRPIASAVKMTTAKGKKPAKPDLLFRFFCS